MGGMRLAICALATMSVAGCADIQGLFGAGEPPPPPPGPSLEKVADDVWIHKSYANVGKTPVLSQGLVVRTDQGVLLVDTAWTDEDTKILIGLVRKEVGDAPELAVFTHAHKDKMGGAEALIESRIATRATAKTNEDARARGLAPAAITILDDADHATLFGYAPRGDAAAEGPVEVYYPGPGHTRDNIVVYYAPAKILFGGCLIRPAASDNLGDTADADIQRWARTVRAVAARYPDAQIVIPSHGPRGGRELLDHTIALAEAAAREGA